LGVMAFPVVELAVILSIVLLAIPVVVAIAGRNAPAILAAAICGATSILIIITFTSSAVVELKIGLSLFWFLIFVISAAVMKELGVLRLLLFMAFMIMITFIVPSIEMLTIIAIFVLTIAVIIREIFPPSPPRSKKLPPSVCRVFCNAWKEATQLVSYTEGSSAVNEEMRKNFIALLSQALGELGSVKPELSREEAKELDSILREVEKIIETLKHRGITTDIYEKMSYISSRLKIIGDKLGCSCS
jgi:hypothetical protein